MKNPNEKMLLYIAMADAYAKACEYVKHDDGRFVAEKCLKFEGYQKHPNFAEPAGFYTDDAEMSVANAKVLIAHYFPFSPLQFADAYVGEFLRGKKRKGYSHVFYDMLGTFENGADFLRKIKPFSVQNGAAMRAVPFGVLRHRDQVLAAATLQATLTHNTSDGIFSARLVALMSHYTLYSNQPLHDIDSYCCSNIPKEDRYRYAHVFKEPWYGPVQETERTLAVNTAHAALWILKEAVSLRGIMERILAAGGDTDTIAAICWGIASARMMNEPLPDFFIRDLEGGRPETGAQYLLAIGNELIRLYF